MSVVLQHKAGENVKQSAPQDTQTRSRLIIGDFGPSDSALAAARGWRLRRPAADRHAARCASRDLCSGGAPRRYPPSTEWHFRTRQTRKQGGKPLARSAIYRLFTDPFYYGWVGYSKGSG